MKKIEIELDLTELEARLLESAISGAVWTYSNPSPYESIETEVLRIKGKRALESLLRKIKEAVR